MNNQPLLSICIPTYNGADRLPVCIEHVLKCAESHNDVEIIISDNCSTDDAQDVLAQYNRYPNVRIYSNETNLGFNGNMRLLLDRYAKGIYCWMIGDDDLIDIDAIDSLKSILLTENPEFVCIKHRFVYPENISSLVISNNRKIKFSKGNYFECIDRNAGPGNVLGTFMSSQIFKLDRVKRFDKTIFTPNTWSDFKTTFPNSYMMLNVFKNESNCIHIATPLISALVHEKEWDDKLSIIRLRIMPSYLDYCYNLVENKKMLKKNREEIEIGIASYNLHNIRKLKFYKVRWDHIFNPYGLLAIIKLTFCKMANLR